MISSLEFNQYGLSFFKVEYFLNSGLIFSLHLKKIGNRISIYSTYTEEIEKTSNFFKDDNYLTIPCGNVSLFSLEDRQTIFEERFDSRDLTDWLTVNLEEEFGDDSLERMLDVAELKRLIVDSATFMSFYVELEKSFDANSHFLITEARRSDLFKGIHITECVCKEYSHD